MRISLPHSMKEACLFLSPNEKERGERFRSWCRTSAQEWQYSILSQDFAHIFLDGRLANTGKEGLNECIAAKLMLEAVKAISKQMPELASLEEALSNYHVRMQQWINKDTHQASCEIQRQINMMSEGGSLLIPIGWKQKRYGHAMLCKITRIRGKFDVCIINTGSGCKKYHQQKIDDRKIRYSPFIYFKGVPAAHLFPGGTTLWLESLLCLTKETQADSFQPEALYEGPFASFWQFYAPLPDEETIFVTPQRNGTCVWQVLLAYSRLELSTESFKRLHWMIRLLVLQRIDLDDRRREKYCRRMICEGIEVFAKETRKKRESGLLSEEEGAVAADLIGEMQAHYAPPKEEISYRTESFPKVNYPNKYMDVRFSTADPSCRVRSHTPALLFNTAPTPYEALIQTTTLANTLAENGGRGVALEMIAHTVLEFPLEATFWDRGFQEKPLGVIFALHELLDTFERLSKGWESAFSIQEIVVAQTLYVHAFEVAKRIQPKWFEGFGLKSPWPNLHPTSSHSPFYQVREEKIQAHIAKLNAYFDQPRSNIPFNFQNQYPWVISDRLMDDEGKLYRQILDLNEERGWRADLARYSCNYKKSSPQQIAQVSETCRAVATMAAGDSDFPPDLLFLRYLQEIAGLASSFVNAGYAITPQSATQRRGVVRTLEVAADGEKIVVIQGEQGEKRDGVPSLYPKLSSRYEERSLLSLSVSTHNLDRTVDEKRDTREASGLCVNHTGEGGDAQANWVLRQLHWSAASRTLQPFQLLTTFAPYCALFEEESVRTLFWLQLFKNPMRKKFFESADLGNLFKQNPLWIAAASRFIQAGLRHMIDLKPSTPDVAGALFFVRVATELCADPSFPLTEETNKIIEECDQRLKELAALDGCTESQLGLLHLHRLHFALMRMERLDEEEQIEAVLISWCGLQLFQIGEEQRLRFLEKSVTSRLYPHLLRWQEDKECDWSEHCQAVFDALGLGRRIPDATPWQRSDSGLALTCDVWCVDLITGALFEEGVQLRRGKSDTATRHPTYRILFGDQVFPSFWKGNVLTFDHPQQGAMRLLYPEDHQRMRVQLCKEDGWYEYLPRKEVRSYPLIPTTMVRKRYFHWVKIGTSSLVFTSTDDWQTASASMGSIINREGKRVLSGYKKPRNFLDSMDLKECQEFEYVNQLLDNVRLPRCRSAEGRPLVFYYREGQYLWGDDVRFAVEKECKAKLLPIEQYIVLKETRSKRRKLLVRLDRLDFDSMDGFETRCKLMETTTNLPLDQDTTYLYLEYDLDGEELTPKSTAGALFLIYLRMQERKFDEAKALLDPLFSIEKWHTLALHLDLLSYIKTYAFESKQCSPIAVAFSLRVTLLHQYDKKERGVTPATNEEESRIANLYSHYLDQLSAIPHRFRLTRNEEKSVLTLLRFLPRTRFKMRRAILSSEKEGEQNVVGITRSFSPLGTPSTFFRNPPPYFRQNIRETFFNSLPLSREYRATDCFFWNAWMAIIGTQEEREKAVYAVKIELGLRLGTKSVYGRERSLSNDLLWFLLGAAQAAERKRLPHSLPAVKSNQADAASETNRWYREQIRPIVKPILQEKREEIVIAEKVEKAPSSLPLPTEKRRDLQLTSDKKSAPLFAACCALYTPLSPSPIAPPPFPKRCAQIPYPKGYENAIEQEIAYLEEEYRAAEAMEKEHGSATLPAEKVSQLRDRLSTQQKEIQEALRIQEGAILNLAHQLPSDRVELLHRTLDLQSGRARQPTIWELEHLFLRRNTALFIDANPALSAQEAEKLFAMMEEWECAQIALLLIEEGMQWVEKIAACDAKEASVENAALRALYCKKLWGVLQNDPASLDGEERVNYLVFNHLSNKHPRLDQRESVDKLTEKCVLTLSMGKGKSAVIAPLRAKRVADRGKLPLVLADKSQYETVCASLKRTQYTCFEQKIFTLDFTREDLDDASLAWIEGELLSGVQEGKVLVMTVEMLQLFDLERFLVVDKITHAAEEEQRQLFVRLKRLNAILHIFKEQVEALGDEFDLIARSDKEVVLPVGEVQRVSPQKVIVASAAIEALCSSKLEVEGKSMRDFVGLATKEQSHLKPKDWEHITPIIARSLAQTCRLLKLPPDEKILEGFVDFVSNRLEDSAHPFWFYVQQLHASADIREQERAELISFVKHLFQDLLPSTCRLTAGRHYGWEEGEEEGKAIPYLAANTPATTEFAYHLEAVVKQLILSVQEGVKESHIEVVATRLYTEALIGVEHNGEVFHQTAEAKSFKKMTGVELCDFKKGDALKRATAYVNTSLERQLMIARETANLYATYYTRSIMSTAQSLPSLLSSLSGMTGTPWNRDSYPNELADSVHRDKGEIGRILLKILERESETVVQTFDPEKFDEELEKFYDAKKKTFAAGLFDAGALFSKSGLTNREIGEKICTFLHKKKCPVQAVLFFNQKGGQAAEFAALRSKEGELVYTPLRTTTAKGIEKANLYSPQEYTAFLPERQTTGTDLPFSPCAEAFMSIDETMTVRTLTQTIMRLRSFLHEQRIHFILSPALKKRIPEGVAPIPYILHLCAINEARDKADSLLRAYRQKIDALFHNRFRSRCEQLTQETERETIKALNTLYAPLIYTVNDDNLFSRCFGMEEGVSTVESLKRYADHQLALFMQKAMEMERLLGAHAAVVVQTQAELEVLQNEIQKLLERAEREAPKMVEELRQLKEKRGADFPLHEMQMRREAKREQKQEQQREQEQELRMELQTELERYACEKRYLPKTECVNIKNSASFIRYVNNAHYEWEKTLPMAIKETDTEQSYHRFASIFTASIFMTDNFCHTTRTLLPLLNPVNRPPNQALAIEKEGTFSLLLLTQFEVTCFLLFLKEAYEKRQLTNVWLINAQGHCYVKPPRQLPLHSNKTLRHALVELNMLGGTLSALFSLKLIDEAKVWMQEGNREAKESWIAMRTEKLYREKGYLPLLFTEKESEGGFISVARAEEEALRKINPEEVSELVDPAEIFKLRKEAMPYVTPYQVPYINAHLIKHLKEREQIQAVPLEKCDQLEEEQIPFISSKQGVMLKKVARIQCIERLTLIGMEDPPATLIRSLSAQQVSWIKEKKWIAHIPDALLPALALPMQKEIGKERLSNLDAALFEALDDEVIALCDARLHTLSPERLGRVAKQELVSRIDDQVNALPPSCAHWIKQSALDKLTNQESISKLEDAKLAYLSPAALQDLPEKRVHALEFSFLCTLYEKVPLLDSKLSYEQRIALYRQNLLQKEGIRNIQKSRDPKWCALLEREELEELLHKDLIPHLSAEKTLLLGYQFRHTTTKQQIALLKGGWNLMGRCFHLSPKEIEALSPREMVRLLPLQREAARYYTDPEVLPHLKTDAQKERFPPKLFYTIRSKELMECVPDSCVEHIHQNYLHLLPPEKRRHIKNEQIYAIRSKEAVGALDDEQILALTSEQLHLLDDARLNALPAEKLEALRDPRAIRKVRGIRRKDLHSDMQHLARYERAHKVTVTLVALTALGGVTLIFGIVVLALPPGKTPLALLNLTQKIGYTGGITLTVCGGGILVVVFTTEMHRRRKERTEQKLDLERNDL